LTRRHFPSFVSRLRFTETTRRSAAGPGFVVSREKARFAVDAMDGAAEPGVEELERLAGALELVGKWLQRPAMMAAGLATRRQVWQDNAFPLGEGELA
jgi:hypothetical protein